MGKTGISGYQRSLKSPRVGRRPVRWWRRCEFAGLYVGLVPARAKGACLGQGQSDAPLVLPGSATLQAGLLLKHLYLRSLLHCFLVPLATH